jgi:hypothetical protein
MKIILQALVLFSFVMSMPSWSMDHTSTDIEYSDSENEQEEMYVQLEQPGTYLAHFSVRAINRGAENANLVIWVNINDTTKEYKQYKISANSTQVIEDSIPFTSHKNDLIEIKFNGPDFVDLETLGVDYIPFEPKTKL